MNLYINLVCLFVSERTSSHHFAFATNEQICSRPFSPGTKLLRGLKLPKLQGTYFSRSSSKYAIVCSTRLYEDIIVYIYINYLVRSSLDTIT